MNITRERAWGNIVVFTLGFLLANIGLLSVSAHLQRELYNFVLPNTKTVLVIGDSRPESAINDKVLLNAFNLADAGEGIFPLT